MWIMERRHPARIQPGGAAGGFGARDTRAHTRTDSWIVTIFGRPA